MLDKLHSMFNEGAIQKVGCVTAMLSHVMELFECEFEENKELKNQAIDALIEVLNREKSS